MSFPLKIAVVEDHVDLREIMVGYLCDQAHDAAGFNCADELDDHLSEESVDLLILDLNLPGENGYSIATRLRAAHPDVYIIMLTARTASEDRIKGYTSGADIYLTKPLSPAELSATVDGVARSVKLTRTRQRSATLNTENFLLHTEHGEITLGKAETLLLKSLAEAPGRRLGYWRLLDLLDVDADDKSKAALEVR
ncbi:MAG: response regulator transcription factor, partial [Rhodoferax sp.]